MKRFLKVASVAALMALLSGCIIDPGRSHGWHHGGDGGYHRGYHDGFHGGPPRH